VLVVEDDPGIATQLVRGLERAGYTADSVSLGAEALRRPPFDVVLLDLGLPDLDGIDVCRRLRADSDTAIIVVTARGEEADRVLALDEGADDYLVKPFDFGELLARLRALQRRPKVSQPPRMVIGAVEFDPATRQVLVRGQAPALTGTEFGILEILMRRSPNVVDRRSIAQHVWDNEADAFGSNTIDVHLARLRAKLTGGGVRIQTVRGVGYRITAA